MRFFERAVRKFRQLYLTLRWTLDLTEGSKKLLIAFIVASSLNAATDGFTVMLAVPILNTASGSNVFEGVPMLQQFGALFVGMDSVERLHWLAGMILIIVVARGALSYFIDIIVYVIPFAVDQRLRMRAFRALNLARMSFVDSISVAEVTSYVSSFPARVGIAARFMAQMASSLITIALMILLLLTITPGTLVAIAVFAVVTSVVFKRLTGRLAIEVSRALTTDQEQFNKTYFEAIHNRKPIRIFRAGDLFAGRIYKSLDNLRRVQVKALAVQAATYPFFSTLGGLFLCMGMLAASMLQPERTEALLGLLVVCLVILFRLIGPITIFHIARMHFATHVEAVEKLHAFFNAVESECDPDGTIEIKDLKGEIRFEDVSFSYGPDKEVLRNVNFRVGPGEMLALVGRSGVGKSTVFHLLTRLYRPTAGRILVDGIDLNDIAIESWWRQLSVVSQDAPIFDGTLRENIAFGTREESSPETYHMAVDLASATEFIDTLPDGLDSMIGEGARVLSSGERQRISLARAFFARPRVVLLDEATSHLDAITEGRIQSALHRLRREGCALIVIAHRLSTIRDANQIVVLDRGDVEAAGTFEDLVAAGGLFGEMVEAQALKH